MTVRDIRVAQTLGALRTEGQGRDDEGDVRGDDVWSGVGLVRVLPVRRTEARGGQGTIRRDRFVNRREAEAVVSISNEATKY